MALGMKDFTSSPHFGGEAGSVSPETSTAGTSRAKGLEVIGGQVRLRPILARCHLVSDSPGAEKASSRHRLYVFGTYAPNELVAGNSSSAVPFWHLYRCRGLPALLPPRTG